MDLALSLDSTQVLPEGLRLGARGAACGVQGAWAGRRGASEESPQGGRRLDKEKKQMRVEGVSFKPKSRSRLEPIFDTVSRHTSNAEHVTNRQKVLRPSGSGSTSDCCWPMGENPR